MYSTRTRVHARISNRHPREEKRASDKNPRTSRRAERAARQDPRAEIGEEVRVGVGVRVCPVEFKLYGRSARTVLANCNPLRAVAIAIFNANEFPYPSPQPHLVQVHTHTHTHELDTIVNQSIKQSSFNNGMTKRMPTIHKIMYTNSPSRFRCLCCKPTAHCNESRDGVDRAL